ncbi:rhodanese-like domain-containing protein [Belliella sp. R4-6]|uniref:Rhodanese-like domain-containing protein n=1 Tax=Belliella alkalica TaxID=1730871 RepID=A0ABS9VB91_9BACT|nr:rhodanese-like domain-containing protein [Belliella alkalica]MCH7413638.1 rhodanese-like domain-containing protein [Belliella alkalica]
MKNTIINSTKKLFLFFTLAMIISISQSFAQSEVKVLTPDKFEKLSKKGRKAVILDIRTPEEVAEGHIENAVFANYSGGNFEEALQSLDKKKTYYVYCRSAKRTVPATEKMKEMGFKKVYMLEGGLNNWIKSEKGITKAK